LTRGVKLDDGAAPPDLQVRRPYEDAPRARRPLPVVKRPPSIEPADWDNLKQLTMKTICERAQDGNSIHHGELAEVVGLPHFVGSYFSLLNAVCVETFKAWGVLLTVLVTNAETGFPGEHFFVLAEQCEHDVTDRMEFVEAERAKAVEWCRCHGCREPRTPAPESRDTSAAESAGPSAIAPRGT